jgi:hypothetical protein
MRTDVAGRVKNTSLAASRPLLPLYEAVVNSVQAIQDAKEADGRIDIQILRDNSLLKNQQPEFREIDGFEVTDNGIGFNEDNYNAFETSDTTYKAQRGGRGIGRFVWLVAFERVEVESHFSQQGKMRCRRFAFLPVGDGIKNMTVADSAQTKPSSVVRLFGFRTKYQQQCPKRLETIGSHLVEHCLEYFIRADCPAG